MIPILGNYNTIKIKIGVKMRSFMYLGLILLLVASCSKEEKIGISTDQPANIAENAYTVTNSGLKYADIKIGSGEEAVAGDSVTVHYSGWLENGKQFDSSVMRNKPLSFKLGSGTVIAGWEEGVAGMKVGGIRQLVIPPDLAYGEYGAAGVIPPNATLIFDVQLLKVKK
jgi:FKBP-type peptidyl-prolyl cis-trans isomerase FkpA